MAEGFQNSDSNKTSEIVERPIQQFFDNWVIEISVSIEELFETDGIDIETWEELLAKLLDGYFFEEYDSYTALEDILKYCMYYTCIVGRFYKVNLILSLDTIFSLLNDRLPNPDSPNVLQKLHEFANFILIDICQKPVSRIFFNLDCHIPIICDNSKQMITLFRDVLPNNSKPSLYCRIIIRYNLNDELGLTSCGNLSDIKPETEASDSNKNIKDKPEESDALKVNPSPKATDQSSKLSPVPKSIDPWQKYGAKPKVKQYSVKSYSKATESREGDERFGSPQSSPSADPRLSENYRHAHARKCSRVAANFALNNKVIDEKGSDESATTSQKSSGFSFPPPLLIMENMKPFRKITSVEDKSVNLENRRDPRLNRDYALPSCSGESTSKHFASPSKDTERFRNLTDEHLVPQNSPSRSDSDFVPFTQTLEQDLICRNFGTRIDEHGNRRFCNPLDKRTVHPTNKILQSRCGSVTADKSREQMDKICLKSYTVVDLGEYEFVTDEELAEMPEGERLVHREYEQMAIALMQSDWELNASSSHSAQKAEAERDEYLPEQSPPPPYKQDASDKVSSTLDQHSLNKELSDQNRIFLLGASADNIERNSSKNVSASYEQIPLAAAGEMCDSAFLDYIQQETASLTIQNEEFSEDHLVYEDTCYSSDESLDVSDPDGSLGHVSELEDNDEAS